MATKSSVSTPLLRKQYIKAKVEYHKAGSKLLHGVGGSRKFLKKQYEQARETYYSIGNELARR